MRLVTTPKLLAAALCSAGLLTIGHAESAGRPDLVNASLAAGRDYVPNELLVQFSPGATMEDKERALGRIGASRDEIVLAGHRRFDGQGDLELVRLPRGMAIVEAMRGVAADRAVTFSEPNWVYQTQAVPTDSYVGNGSLWGMYGASTIPANAFGTGALAVWDRNPDIATKCAGVYVGIIDEGYYYGHQDLVAGAARNPGEVGKAAGVDDDGNGLADDIWGWDFANNDASVFDGTSDDHGTHVAGTIGAAINGAGVVGVCPGVRLMNAKFLGRNGGTTANAIKAVDYFTNLKTRATNAVPITATNNSWGGGGFSQALKDAIDRANTAGILFVAAAGNSTYNCDTTDCYPANYASANVIAVASITSTGAISSFSNYGQKNIHLGAPGSGIYSTVPVSSKGAMVSGYASYSGTSMATPHVTGAAALYKALNPTATAAQIKAAILGSVTPTASLATNTVTGGRLNVSGF